MAVTDSEPIRARPDLSADEPAAAFALLYDEHARTLHRYLALRVGEHAAYDLVSETFLVALRQRHSYDPARAVVRAWLFGIASNLLRRQARQERRHQQATARAVSRHDQADSDDDVRIAERLDAATAARRLAPALAELSESDRDLLLLTSVAGLSAAEVADALGIPAGTVRSRLDRIRTRVRGRLHDSEGERQ